MQPTDRRRDNVYSMSEMRKEVNGSGEHAKRIWTGVLVADQWYFHG